LGVCGDSDAEYTVMKGGEETGEGVNKSCYQMCGTRDGDRAMRNAHGVYRLLPWR